MFRTLKLVVGTYGWRPLQCKKTCKNNAKNILEVPLGLTFLTQGTKDFVELWEIIHSKIWTHFFNHCSQTCSSNKNEIFSIISSANVFGLGNLNAQDKDWLTYFGGTEKTFKFSYNYNLKRPYSNLTQLSYLDHRLWFFTVLLF